jgi:hypothetical protein
LRFWWLTRALTVRENVAGGIDEGTSWDAGLQRRRRNNRSRNGPSDLVLELPAHAPRHKILRHDRGSHWPLSGLQRIQKEGLGIRIRDFISPGHALALVYSAIRFLVPQPVLDEWEICYMPPSPVLVFWLARRAQLL